MISVSLNLWRTDDDAIDYAENQSHQLSTTAYSVTDIGLISGPLVSGTSDRIGQGHPAPGNQTC